MCGCGDFIKSECDKISAVVIAGLWSIIFMTLGTVFYIHDEIVPATVFICLTPVFPIIILLSYLCSSYGYCGLIKYKENIYRPMNIS